MSLVENSSSLSVYLKYEIKRNWSIPYFVSLFCLMPGNWIYPGQVLGMTMLTSVNILQSLLFQ
jgi:hypothetical protein